MEDGDHGLCVIWDEDIGLMKVTSWVTVVGLPLLLGPILSLLLELVLSLIHSLHGSTSTDIRHKRLLLSELSIVNDISVTGRHRDVS